MKTLLICTTLLLAVSACDGAAETSDTTQPTQSSVTASSVTTTSVIETSPPSTAPTTSTPVESTTTTDASSTTMWEDHDFAAKESPEYPESGQPAYLESVTVETEEAAARVLSELDMETEPSFRATYVSDPVVASPSGNEIDLAGDAKLLVTLTPTAGVDLSGEEAVETFQGEDRFSPESSNLIREVAETEDFESVVTWAIGLEQKTPFAVGFDENHFVVEFVTEPTPTASATLVTSANGIVIAAALTEGGTCAAVQVHEATTTVCDPVPDDEAPTASPRIQRRRVPRRIHE